MKSVQKIPGRWLLAAGSMLATLFLAGCTSPERYVEVAREQSAAIKEIADILEKVEDKKSMAEAKIAIDERLDRFEQIAKKAQSLPRPSDEANQRLQQEKFILDGFTQRLHEQVRRVRALPGGADFFKQFQSKSPNLFSAVQS